MPWYLGISNHFVLTCMAYSATAISVRGGNLLVCVGAAAVGGGEGGGTGLTVPGAGTLLACGTEYMVLILGGNLEHVTHV